MNPPNEYSANIPSSGGVVRRTKKKKLKRASVVEGIAVVVAPAGQMVDLEYDCPLTYPVQPVVIKGKQTLWEKFGGGPLTIALILHLVVIVLGAIWIFQIIYTQDPVPDFLPGGGGSDRGTGYQVKNEIRAQQNPVSKVKHVFAQGAKATFLLPDQSDDLSKMSSMAAGGSGSGLGSGFGKGVGDGQGLGTMGKRCTKEDRLQRLKQYGGVPECEDAVRKGLRWLKANQNPDGSWNGQDKVAMTGLALLAYFGHCETPASPEFGESCMKGIIYLVNVGMITDGVLMDHVFVDQNAAPRANRGDRDNRDERDTARLASDALSALDSLNARTPAQARDAQAQAAREAQAEAVREAQAQAAREAQVQAAREARAQAARDAKARNSRQRGNANPYAHAIATYALGEATIFCKEINKDIPYLIEITEKAGQFIIDNQHKSSGGWDYNYATDSPRGGDVSIVGWQLQALKACSHTGIKYNGMDACVYRALDYLKTCQNYNGGYGYTNAHGERDSLTGIGMLSNQMWGKGNSPEVDKAAGYLIGKTTFDIENNPDLYAHYYISQAMMQSGGDDWKKYNGLFRDKLLKHQDADGSWKAPRDRWARDPVFSTCFCTLMMEVYYRFLSTDDAALKKPGK